MKLTWGRGVVTSGSIGQGVHIKCSSLISGYRHDMQRVDMVLGPGVNHLSGPLWVWLGRHLLIRRKWP